MKPSDDPDLWMGSMPTAGDIGKRRLIVQIHILFPLSGHGWLIFLCATRQLDRICASRPEIALCTRSDCRTFSTASSNAS